MLVSIQLVFLFFVNHTLLHKQIKQPIEPVLQFGETTFISNRCGKFFKCSRVSDDTTDAANCSAGNAYSFACDNFLLTSFGRLLIWLVLFPDVSKDFFNGEAAFVQHLCGWRFLFARAAQ